MGAGGPHDGLAVAAVTGGGHGRRGAQCQLNLWAQSESVRASDSLAWVERVNRPLSQAWTGRSRPLVSSFLSTLRRPDAPGSRLATRRATCLPSGPPCPNPNSPGFCRRPTPQARVSFCWVQVTGPPPPLAGGALQSPRPPELWVKISGILLFVGPLIPASKPALRR
jgi:hypothetical protein